MNKFKLPIGDWSNDGHGKCDYHIIESNKTVEEIREIYFQAKEKLGFGLEGHDDLTPCAEYEEYTMKQEAVDALKTFGLTITKEQEEQWINEYVDKNELSDLILNFLKIQDPDLILNKIPEEDMPMLPFYGYDNKQRHIDYFGYGLFD